MHRCTLIAVLATLSLAAAAGAACIPGTSPGAIQTELNAGRNAVLCQNATFNITYMITFAVNGTQIYTEGAPTGATRAKLRIASAAVQTIIYGVDKSNIQIRNVIIDGARPTYGYVRPNAEGLIRIGGNASGQKVQYVEAYEPRGWTAMAIYHGDLVWNGTAWVGGCTAATITNNFIHDSGDVETRNWADGISLSCRNSYVGYNTVQDATDGGIVVFGSPGSTIEFNTVRNINRTGLGGICMVDTTYRRWVSLGAVQTEAGDFTGTSVQYNTVEANAEYCGLFCFPTRLYIGIAMGPRIWWCSPPNGVVSVYGGKAIGNHLTGNAMANGMPADGVLNWTATGNTSDAYFMGITSSSSCGGTNTQNAFVKHSDGRVPHATGTFQPEYIVGQGHHLHPF
ncbi:MAG TPA: hypothetical protein VJ276_01785 [Thermoanaerobaculia bacterium]|nr:hypothetical protein [Thermoanaerobaculia bacterium]